MKNTLHKIIFKFIQIAGLSLLLSGTSYADSNFCVPPSVLKAPPNNGPNRSCEDGNCNIDGSVRPPCTVIGGELVCHAKSGNMQKKFIDLDPPTRGFPIQIERTYDSFRGADGFFGDGMTSNLTMTLIETTYAASVNSTVKQAVVTYPDGLIGRFTQNSDGTYTAPTGTYERLVKNADGSYDLNPKLSRTRYHFNSNGRLESITDEFGNALNYTYDASDRPIQISDATGSGRYISVTYGADGRVATVADHTGRTVQYVFDPSTGKLTSITDPANLVNTYTYTQGRFSPLLSDVTDNWGRAVNHLTYDTSDRLATYNSMDETLSLSYDTVNNQVTQTDANGFQLKFTYNTLGKITSKTITGATLESSTYTADGLLQQFTDAVGVKTFYTYNSDGSVATATRDYQGSGASSSPIRFDYTYDPAFPGKVTNITPHNPSTGAVDTNWQAFSFDYYQPGATAPGALQHAYKIWKNATQETLATYSYNAAGQVTSVLDEAGATTSYEYDPVSGDLVSVILPPNADAGSTRTYAIGRDALGRVSSVTDPMGHSSFFGYDNLHRMISATQPPPSPGSPLNFTTTISYDQIDVNYPNNVFSISTDPNGRTQSQGYDAYGRPTVAIDSLGHVTRMSYLRGQLSSITDPNGNVTAYQYDNLRNSKQTTFPDGSIETYSFRNDGTPQSVLLRDNSASIPIVFDNLKRLTSYNGQTYTYTGQMLTQVSQTWGGGETQQFIYDTAYRLQTHKHIFAENIDYTYDSASRLATYTVTGGPTATYAYYPDSSLNTITWGTVPGQFKFQYFPNGQYQTVTFPNGQHRDYAYDDLGRLLQIANIHPTAGNLATYGYGYDIDNTTSLPTLLGPRTSMTADVPGQSLSGALTKYYYDGVYQLNRADYPSASPFNSEVASWTYDGDGNRLTNTVNGVTNNYTSKLNGTNVGQLLQTDAINSFTYDGRGNTKTKSGPEGLFNFTWNTFNQMTVLSGPGVNETYTYDWAGRRLAVITNGGNTVTRYIQVGSNVVAERGATTADYLFGPSVDQPLAMLRGGSVYYFDVDGLGSVNAVNNASGAITNKYLMDAWGVLRSQTTGISNPFGYTGREFAPAGLMYYRARHMNPSTGHFMSEDPIRFGGGNSFYSYVGNDPITFTDPLGLYNKQTEYWAEQFIQDNDPRARAADIIMGTFAASVPDSIGIGGDATLIGPPPFAGDQIGKSAQWFPQAKDKCRFATYTNDGPIWGIPQAGGDVQVNLAWSPHPGAQMGANTWKGKFYQATGGWGNWSATVFWSPGGFLFSDWRGLSIAYGRSVLPITANAGYTNYNYFTKCDCPEK